MPRTKISEFSATAADNTDIDGINLGEGMLPSDVNNAMRELMAQLKDLQAGTSGDTIPLTAGGTGATTASAARTALGATTTGNDLFTSASASAARTTLGATTTGNSLFTAVDAAAGRTAISAASSGANSDITSLTGLTTALSASQGGTGLTSAGTSGNVLLSNGTEWVSGTVNAGALATASTSGLSQTVSFAVDAVHNALCNAGVVEFTFGSPASVAKVDLVLSTEPIGSYSFGGIAFDSIKVFSVAAQETAPTGIFFKPDGTRMFVIGSTGDDVNEYSLSTAWDVSTATYVQNFSVSAQESVSSGLFFKPDGTRMYITGSSGDDVNEYSLSTAWDISTASFVQLFSVSTQDIGPTGLFFKPDGLKMYITGTSSDSVHEYSLSTAWDISTASFVQSFSISSLDINPSDIFFKPDGTRMYLIGQNSGVIEYKLSTPWNISTASFSSKAALNISEGSGAGLFFKDDGTELYIISASIDAVVQLALEGAWVVVEVPTPSLVQSFSVVGQDTAPVDLFFKPDGTKMYVLGFAGDDVNEYSLSTAWDISTASYVQNFSVATEETAPTGLFFKDDGTRMYIIGQTGNDVNEYSLSTAWDISTASYVQNFSVATQETSPNGIFFKPDGTKMFVIGESGDDVNEYSLSTAWDISTASFVQVFSVATQDTSPTGLFFTPDGTRMFILGDSDDDINLYLLSTAWDISTADFVELFSVGAQDTSPAGLFFKSDGTRMYVSGKTNASVYEYLTSGFPTIVFPSNLELPPVTIDENKTAISIVTSDGGTTYQAISVQGGIE
jgi:sugar lactone lactonase YvrE